MQPSHLWCLCVVSTLLCWSSIFPSLSNAQQMPAFRRQGPDLQSPSSQPLEIPKDRQNELELPRASEQFVGRWGGHLYSLSQEPGLGSEPISFAFGQKADGTMFFTTGIWGSPSMQQISASAEVKSPQKIKIIEVHLAVHADKTLRVVQKSNLLLKPNHIIDCLETVQIFNSESENSYYGEPRPEYSAVFHGALRLLTASEESALADEVRQKGSVRQGEVTGSSNFSN